MSIDITDNTANIMTTQNTAKLEAEKMLSESFKGITSPNQVQSNRAALRNLTTVLVATSAGVIDLTADNGEHESAQKDEESQKKHELTLEQVETTISALKARFESKPIFYVRQKSIDFAAVERSLRSIANKEMIWSLHTMVLAGAQPDILEQDDSLFLIGETFDELIADRANCVYDAEAEELVGSENCNGNAVSQASSHGSELMRPSTFQQYFKALPSSQYCLDYLHTEDSERFNGLARLAYRNLGYADVVLRNATDHSNRRGWRGALRVQKAS